MARKQPANFKDVPHLGQGRTQEVRKAMRNLALVVREGVPADIMRDFHLFIAMGNSPIVVRASNGDLEVQAEEHGMAPTLDQRVSAMKWLAERGYGLPAQTIHLEAELRAQIASTTETLPIGQLSLGTMRMIREALRARPVLDVASREHAPASAKPPELSPGEAEDAHASVAADD